MELKRILVTGATGNVGMEVVHYLTQSNTKNQILAAVRNVESAQRKFPNAPALKYVPFDFEDPDTFSTAFEDIDILFLLRPPHLSNVEQYFKPLLDTAKSNGIKDIAFLSVQGAESSKLIPHHKIEQLILQLGFNYIFVRPSYFMQNLTTTFRSDIIDKKCITLPSAKSKFNWIDVKNIGEAIAQLILDFDQYKNQPYEITGNENMSFPEATHILSEIREEKIRFQSINPIRFYFKKKREGMDGGYALVMTLLHFLPRIQKEPEISDNYHCLTGKEPTTLYEFLKREFSKVQV